VLPTLVSSDSPSILLGGPVPTRIVVVEFIEVVPARSDSDLLGEPRRTAGVDLLELDDLEGLG
jgi:hypothetical protein